jgi:hypothetical protein
MISVGDLDRNSDGTVLKNGAVYHVITEGTNFLPPPLPTEEDKLYFSCRGIQCGYFPKEYDKGTPPV